MSAKTKAFSPKERQEPEAAEVEIADPSPVVMPLEFHMIQDANVRAVLEFIARQAAQKNADLKVEIEEVKKSIVRNEHWDHTPKRNHQLIRECILKIIEERKFIRLRNVRDDPVLQTTHIKSGKQWERELDWWLIPGKPRPPGDTSEIRRFTVPRGRWGVLCATREDYLYCGIERAVKKIGATQKPPQTPEEAKLAAIRTLRRQFGAEDPERCNCPDHRAARGDTA